MVHGFHLDVMIGICFKANCATTNGFSNELSDISKSLQFFLMKHRKLYNQELESGVTIVSIRNEEINLSDSSSSRKSIANHTSTPNSLETEELHLHTKKAANLLAAFFVWR